MALTKSKSITEKLTDAAEQAKDSDLVHKLLDDPNVRQQASKALQSLQNRAEDIQKTQQKISKKAEKKLKKAEKKQAELAEQIEAAKPAEKPKKKRHPVRKLLFVATLGAVVALVVSEDARKAVLDGLFGAEEEFEYTSSTARAATSSNGAS